MKLPKALKNEEPSDTMVYSPTDYWSVDEPINRQMENLTYHVVKGQNVCPRLLSTGTRL